MAVVHCSWDDLGLSNCVVAGLVLVMGAGVPIRADLLRVRV
jgi:hypothetical protein